MVNTSPAIRALYEDQYAGGVERDVRAAGARDKVDNIVRAIARAGIPTVRRIVEIGSGEGALAAEMSLRGMFESYRGFDVSSSGIEEATSRGLAAAEFTLIGGGSIPVPDDSADLVVMSHVVEHLEHPRILLREAGRIAEHVLVEVPLELNARMPRDYRVDALGHINKYTSGSIRHFVQSCDFDVLCQFTTNPPHALHGEKWTRRRRLDFAIKNVSLRATPQLARAMFTYHETLLLRRLG